MMEELLTEVLRAMRALDRERSTTGGWWEVGQIAEKTPNMEVRRVAYTLDELVERERAEGSGDVARGDGVYRALYTPDGSCDECGEVGLMSHADYLCPRCRADKSARDRNFSGLSAYLEDRRRVQKWPTGRIADELEVSAWDVDQLGEFAG